MNKSLKTENRDIHVPALLLAGALLLFVKLLLSRAQQVYLLPDGSSIDDMFMYNTAVSIAKGEWLGSYNWLTLSKQSFFALWLAGLHKLGIPFLLGGQLLWAAGSAAAAWAVAPALKKRWLGLVLFAVLLFSPSSTANAAPLGYITRVYRDNIFPALCLLCVAGMVGFALRRQHRLSRAVGWLCLAGTGLAGCWLTREDGWWLLPFVIAAALLTVLLFFLEKPKQWLLRCTALLLPFLLLAAGTLGWRAANYAHYGRFILTDFSAGEFADAVGAMSRIHHWENEDPKVLVPREVRHRLYELVPAFAELEPCLEGWLLWEYAGGNDYSAGAFHWALRHAASEAGYYETPQKAQTYFEGLARDINALCEEGLLAAGPRRSSVNPAVRPEHVAPVLQETAHSLWFCAIFRQCDARSLFSTGGNDPAFYAEKLQPMEQFLHEKALAATKENSAEPYFTPLQQFAFKVFDALRLLYAVLLPLALAAALAWQVWAALRWFRSKNKLAAPGLMLWLCQLGLLCCILLRALMIAFVTVSSFNIGTYIMYLASIHPLMLLFGFVGSLQLARLLWRGKGKKQPPLHAKGAG